MESQQHQAHAEPVSAPVPLPAGYDPTMYDRGLLAFERDLPELLKTHHRQWVVYHGERRFGPAEKIETLDLACRRARIPVGERVYRLVEPETDDYVIF